jgi:hypothetical protein
LEKLPIRPPGRDRADLVGYKYLRNNGPRSHWRCGQNASRPGASVPVFHLAGNLRNEFQRALRSKFKNGRPDFEACSLNQWQWQLSARGAAAAATTNTTKGAPPPPDGRRGQAGRRSCIRAGRFLVRPLLVRQANCPVLCRAVLCCCEGGMKKVRPAASPRTTCTLSLSLLAAASEWLPVRSLSGSHGPFLRTCQLS